MLFDKNEYTQKEVGVGSFFKLSLNLVTLNLNKTNQTRFLR